MSGTTGTMVSTKTKGTAMPRESHFFAIVTRMKYIERWALMRNSRAENLSEHSLEVAMIAHALCTIGNVRYDRALNADRAALVSLYHDASEIITGDMPTPVKYRNERLRGAYKEVEAEAEQELLATLPDDLRLAFEDAFVPRRDDAADAYLHELVKAADKLSAYIKCLEEASQGNEEFRTAAATTLASLKEMRATHPEVGDFMDEFLPSYGRTLDELL